MLTQFHMSELHAPSAPNRYRLLAAFAVLPFVDGLAAFVGFPVVWYMGGHDGQPYDPAQAARGFAILTGFLGLLVTISGAVPMVFWLMKRGPVSFGQLIAVGLLLGNAPFLIYVVGVVLPMTALHLFWGTLSQHLVSMSELIAGTLRVVAIGSVMGGLSATVFWLIAMYHGGSGVTDAR
jgi:hypothetical protein